MSKRNLLQYESMNDFNAKEDSELQRVNTVFPGVASVKVEESESDCGFKVFYNHPKYVPVTPPTPPIEDIDFGRETKRA